MANEYPPSLAAALVNVQAEMPTVGRSSTASIPGRDGKQGYQYTYADLADVARAILPLLVKNGLAFTCLGRQAGNTYELVGTLLHVSGEKIEGALPITGRTPQELGSSITYARRYLLGAMTGIVTDEDDDGGTATAAVFQREEEERARQHKAMEVEKARGDLRRWATQAGWDLRSVAATWEERHPQRPKLGEETEPALVARFHQELVAETQAAAEQELAATENRPDPNGAHQ